MKFQTDCTYHDRESKANYVWLKYNAILKGNILDVGADEGFLKQHLPKDSTYWGIDIGGAPDQRVDLEKRKIPYPDGTFDCVLCLDVLEHLDNIHDVFDDLCRVTDRFVIIALPNPWADFYRMLCLGDYRPGQAMKFYGLPEEKTEDRHKWFFSYEEAVRFISFRAERNGLRIVQIDHETYGSEARGPQSGLLNALARAILFRRDLRLDTLRVARLWAVLEKLGSREKGL